MSASCRSAFAGNSCLNSWTTCALSCLVIFPCFELRNSTFLNMHFTPPTSDTTEINLTATGGNSIVNLNWSTNINAEGYVVKRSTTPGGPYEVIANNVTDKSYVDNNVQNGTTYYYVVTALENGAETKTSNEASATPTAGGSTGPDPDIKGNRALLVITMTNANRKEYDMSADEIKAFINWYNRRTNGSGLKYYVINKNYNIGPFSSRKDHIVFDQISDFEVMKYNK
ncbi:Amylopullulanase precursor [compost metagenome]